MIDMVSSQAYFDRAKCLRLFNSLRTLNRFN